VRATIPAGNAAGLQNLVGGVRERGNDARHHFLTVIAAIVGRFSLPLVNFSLAFERFDVLPSPSGASCPLVSPRSGREAIPSLFEFGLFLSHFDLGVL
jgi:hypothetical protein